MTRTRIAAPAPDPSVEEILESLRAMSRDELRELVAKMLGTMTPGDLSDGGEITPRSVGDYLRPPRDEP